MQVCTQITILKTMVMGNCKINTIVVSRSIQIELLASILSEIEVSNYMQCFCRTSCLLSSMGMICVGQSKDSPWVVFLQLL